MKIILNIILLISLNICYAQSKIDSLINNHYSYTEKILKDIVPSKILTENFEQNRKNMMFEVFNIEKDKLQRLNFKAFKKTNNNYRQILITYDIIINGKILSVIGFAFDNQGKLLNSISGIQEELKPKLKVLENRTKIDLNKAIEIARENGMIDIYYWNIDYEKRKLVWTIKSKFKDNQRKIITINSKNGKIMSDYIEIPID